jgi:hypothetical protein
MLTIPAAFLGTKQDVEVRDVGGNSGAALFKSRYTNPMQPSIKVSFNSLADLLAWTKTLPQVQLDQLAELFLPTAQYTSVWMDCSLYTWGPMVTNAATSLAPASAFKVGDSVVWSPTKPVVQPHGSVAGATYVIIGCAFQGPPACWSLSNYLGGALVNVADEDELTLCCQPSSNQLTLPLGTTTGITGTGIVVPYAKKCECGASKCKSNIHSTWCQLYVQ